MNNFIVNSSGNEQTMAMFYVTLRKISVLLAISFCLNKKFVNGNGLSDSEWQNTWKCVPIKLDICKDIVYNETIDMDGGVLNPYTNKTNQDESKKDLSDFALLLKTKCSVHLRLLLCSVYLPLCSAKVEKPISACRPLCEEVKSKCLPYFNDYGFEWPLNLECSRFPKENSVGSLCINGGLTPFNGTEEVTETTAPLTKRKISELDDKIYTINRSAVTSKGATVHIHCGNLYSRNSENYFFLKRTKTCVLECYKNGLFSSDEKDNIEKWISALSSCCCLICSVALIVVLAEYNKVLHAERAVVFITASFVFYSIGHIIRIVYTRENISCGEENGRKYILHDGSANIACSSIFVLSYGFFMAQNIWWVILTISWFLSSGLKWKQQALANKFNYFHIIAWGVPCAKTLVILVLRKIDGNELTGMCSIGNQLIRLSSLSGFVLGPLFTYLITGTIFLFFGILVSYKLSSCKSSPDSKTVLRFGQEALSVGVYAVLHALFSAYILSSYFYEYFNRASWTNDAYLARPNFNVFLLRTIFEFMIGITAAVWLLMLHFPAFYKRLKQKIKSPHQTSPLLSRRPYRTNGSQI